MIESVISELDRSERHRLAVLNAYCVLDTQPDVLCDLVTELATQLFSVEISLVSLVAENRQWFKSKRGLSAGETPRADSFCAHAIKQDQPMVILDAKQDERFALNPLVMGEPHIRFYVGAPLITTEGLRLGTLCVIGKTPRTVFSANDLATLQRLASIVMARLDTLRVSNYIDHLTALPNLSRLIADLQTLSEEARSTEDLSQMLTAVAVDICAPQYLSDMVKALGWDYAEGFLMQAKERLVQILPKVTLYRIGNTTFSYLERPDNWREQAKRLKESFSGTLHHQGIPHHLEIVVGVVPFVECAAYDDVVPFLLTTIDAAREQGIFLRCFDKPLGQEQKFSFELLSSIPGALLEDNEFSLEFQPKVSLISGQCSGMEALIRWRHPIHGNISPGLFIPLAEKTALIRQVTPWVLRAGVLQAATWLRQGRAIPIAINVSARDFDNDELLHTLVSLLEEYRLPPDLIEIEFTESAMSKNPENLHARILEIKRLGVGVAIDDFGAGFSNLSYLKNIPADYMKIDQSFIRTMESDRADQQIVPSIINLGQKLGFAVIAEGIESEKSRRILGHLGCDYGQGYAIAKPMAAADAWQWFLSRN